MKMRKFLALAAVVLAASFSVPASAQSADGILRLLGRGTSISNALGRNCSYYGGISQVTCQVQRVDSVTRQIDMQRQRMQNSRRQAEQRAQRVNQALIRACKLGDQDSCRRAGPVLDQKETQLQQAIAQACEAGDRHSCDRLQSMRRETYAQQTRYRDADDYGY